MLFLICVECVLFETVYSLVKKQAMIIKKKYFVKTFI